MPVPQNVWFERSGTRIVGKLILFSDPVKIIELLDANFDRCDFVDRELSKLFASCLQTAADISIELHKHH